MGTEVWCSIFFLSEELFVFLFCFFNGNKVRNANIWVQAVHSIILLWKISFSILREQMRWQCIMALCETETIEWPKKITSQIVVSSTLAGRQISSWQLADRRYLHCLKVDGDGEENQCGCKQCNGRAMCSPGRAQQQNKSCQGNARTEVESGCRFLPAHPVATFNPHAHFSSWSQTSRLSPCVAS